MQRKIIVFLDETHHVTREQNLSHHWCNQLANRYDIDDEFSEAFFKRYESIIAEAIVAVNWPRLRDLCSLYDMRYLHEHEVIQHK